MTIDEHVRAVVSEIVASELAKQLAPLIARMQTPAPIYLTAAQVADEWGISARMVRLLAEQGAPAIRVGSALRFQREEMDVWMRAYAASPRKRTRKTAR